MPQFDFAQYGVPLMWGGALIAIAAAFWSRTKTLLWRVINLLVVKMTVAGSAENAVRTWLWRHGRRSRFGERSYEGERLMVRKLERRLLVGFELPSPDPSIIWIGWRPILMYIGAHQFGQGGNAGSNGIRLTLMFLRWSFDPDKLMMTAINEFNSRTEGDHFRRYAFRRAVGMRGTRTSRSESRGDGYTAPGIARLAESNVEQNASSNRFLGYTPDEIGPPIPEDPMGFLAIPTHLDPVLKSVRRWLRSEKWFKKRSIPWRMGLAMVGKPGVGKTVTAKALAQELDLPIAAFELATFTDQDMVAQWHGIQADAPCMVLIEDIDTVFEGRKNIAEGDEPGLSFGCLLNCLSGIEGADGILTIITTNRPETLDPALGQIDEQGRSSRPGRIDKIVELRQLDEKGRRHIANRILEDCPEEIEKAVLAGDDESGAQFTQRCAEIAMERFRQAEELELQQERT